MLFLQHLHGLFQLALAAAALTHQRVHRRRKVAAKEGVQPFAHAPHIIGALEDVAGASADTQASQGSSQAIAALVSLGYSQSEAALAVSKIDAALPVEEIIKLALRSMAGRR